MAQALTYLTKAKAEKFAIGAFNAASLETLRAIVSAARKLSAPVIIEASPGESEYVGIKRLVSLVRSFEEEFNVALILNIDHGKDFESCKKAVDAGFDYVHLDGSKLPLAENIRQTSKLVDYAHKHGVVVEGEMDHIEGSSADHTHENTSQYQNPSQYTDPQKAKAFVEKTGVDVFASFVGNLHGVYANEKRLNFAILKEISKQIPHTFLSLHGGSGVNSDDIKQAIQNGVVKINVNTELRIAFKMTLQEVLNNTNEIAVYKLMEKPVAAVQKVVEGKIRLFGTVNHS